MAELTKSVLLILQNCNLRVLTIVTDNNRVNRVLFNILTEQCESKYYFQIPKSPIRTYVTYDSVHVLKNIHNNWLNLKNHEKTFYIPLMENENNIVKEAKFQDTVALYKKECNILIKSAPKLSAKTIYSTNFERQKVSLVLNIFNESTFAAVSTFLGENSGTAHFLHIIITWLITVNVKRKMTHIIKKKK